MKVMKDKEMAKMSQRLAERLKLWNCYYSRRRRQQEEKFLEVRLGDLFWNMRNEMPSSPPHGDVK